MPEPEVFEGNDVSQLEQENKDRDYKTTMLDAQLDDLKGEPPAEEVINMQSNLIDIKNEKFLEKKTKDD